MAIDWTPESVAMANEPLCAHCKKPIRHNGRTWVDAGPAATEHICAGMQEDRRKRNLQQVDSLKSVMFWHVVNQIASAQEVATAAEMIAQLSSGADADEASALAERFTELKAELEALRDGAALRKKRRAGSVG